jgi:hypothetical protein
VTWLVYRVRGARAAYLGSISAPSRETAIELAYDEFQLVEADRRRLITQRMDSHA